MHKINRDKAQPLAGNSWKCRWLAAECGPGGSRRARSRSGRGRHWTGCKANAASVWFLPFVVKAKIHFRSFLVRKNRFWCRFFVKAKRPTTWPRPMRGCLSLHHLFKSSPRGFSQSPPQPLAHGHHCSDVSSNTSIFPRMLLKWNHIMYSVCFGYSPTSMRVLVAHYFYCWAVSHSTVPPLVYSLTSEGHCSCFQFGAIIDKDAVSILVQVLCGHIFYISSR